MKMIHSSIVKFGSALNEFLFSHQETEGRDREIEISKSNRKANKQNKTTKLLAKTKRNG